VLFVLPHCEELSIYGAHIKGTFLANPSTPDRVSKYDRRVRTRVAESPRIRLSDVSAFFPDYAASILAQGPLLDSGFTGTQARPGVVSESVCLKFAGGSISPHAVTREPACAARACIFYAVLAMLAILPTFNL
jgi:hypothetical protein